MTDSPLVSVIVPAYNARAFIHRALESALGQTYPHLEVIVVDDGSTDGTAEVVRRTFGHDARLYVVTQANAGPSAARNHGARLARGIYLHFLDADDWWTSDKIERSLALFQSPEIAVVYGHGIAVDADTLREIPQDFPPLPSGDVFCDWLVGVSAGGNYGVTPSFMIRHEAFEACGGFDESMWVAEDFDLWLRLAHDYHFAALDSPLVYYLRRSGGLHTQRVRMAQGRLRVYQKAGALPRRPACMDDNTYARELARRSLTLGLRLWEAGQRAEARAMFRQSVKYHREKARISRLYTLMSYALPARTVDLLLALRDRVKRG